MFEKMGGRKFLMAVIVVTAGVVIEVYSKNGLSATMVTLLTAVYATFSTANAFVTRKFADVSQEAEEEEEEVTPVQPAAPSNLEAIIQSNNVQLNNILSQIAAELLKQATASTSLVEGVNSVQATQANIQKGITLILGRGA